MAGARAGRSRVVALSGIVFLGLAVALNLAAPRLSYSGPPNPEAWSDFELGGLALAFMVGSLIAIVGILAWARHFGRAARFKAAGGLLLAGLPLSMGMIDTHRDPGFMLLLLTLEAWFLSLVLMCMAIFKRRRESSS